MSNSVYFVTDTFYLLRELTKILPAQAAENGKPAQKKRVVKGWVIMVPDSKAFNKRRPVPLHTKQGHLLLTNGDIENYKTPEGKALTYTLSKNKAVLNEEIRAGNSFVVYDPPATKRNANKTVQRQRQQQEQGQQSGNSK